MPCQSAHNLRSYGCGALCDLLAMQYNIGVVWIMLTDMRSVNMRNLEAAPGVGEELQSMTKATGAALVSFGEQTFVVVEVRESHCNHPLRPMV